MTDIDGDGEGFGIAGRFSRVRQAQESGERSCESHAAENWDHAVRPVVNSWRILPCRALALHGGCHPSLGPGACGRLTFKLSRRSQCSVAYQLGSVACQLAEIDLLQGGGGHQQATLAFTVDDEHIAFAAGQGLHRQLHLH